MGIDQVRRDVYEYLYRHQRAALDDIIDAIDSDANTVYGACKHLKWDDYLDADTGNNEFWIETQVPGLCAECNAETELNDEILEVCPECGWQETWTCGECGATEHDSMEFPLSQKFDAEVEVDVTCESVYITPVDGGSGFAFDHAEFRAMVELFNSSEYTAGTDW